MKRYCGNAEIDIKLVPAQHMPHGEQYECVIKLDGKKLGTQYVGLPVVLKEAVDSPRMYDRAAFAALSFAMNECETGENDDYCDLESELDYNDIGYKITRKK